MRERSSTIRVYGVADTRFDFLKNPSAACEGQMSDIQSINIRSNKALRATSIEIFDPTFEITAALRLLATVVAFLSAC